MPRCASWIGKALPRQFPAKSEHWLVRREANGIDRRRSLVAAVTGLGSQRGFISEAKHQFQNSLCEFSVGGRELNRSARAAVAIRVEQPGEQGAALSDGRLQILLRNVLTSKLPEDSAECPVADPGRRGWDECASPSLREAAIRCAKHGGKADARVKRCTFHAHSLSSQGKRFSDTMLTFGTVRNCVLHAGAGVVGDHVSVGADMIQNLLFCAREPGSHRDPVTQPAAV